MTNLIHLNNSGQDEQQMICDPNYQKKPRQVRFESLDGILRGAEQMLRLLVPTDS
jgi:hypothetical protein